MKYTAISLVTCALIASSASLNAQFNFDFNSGTVADYFPAGNNRFLGSLSTATIESGSIKLHADMADLSETNPGRGPYATVYTSTSSYSGALDFVSSQKTYSFDGVKMVWSSSAGSTFQTQFGITDTVPANDGLQRLDATTGANTIFFEAHKVFNDGSGYKYRIGLFERRAGTKSTLWETSLGDYASPSTNDYFTDTDVQFQNITITLDATSWSLSGIVTSQGASADVTISESGTFSSTWDGAWNTGSTSLGLQAYMTTNNTERTTDLFVDNISVTSVPEPSMFALILSASIGLLVMNRRRRA